MGCVKLKGLFFGNKSIHNSIVHIVVDIHDWKHHQTCFKKGLECPYFLPTPVVQRTKLYYQEKPGKVRDITWHCLVECDTMQIPVWSVETKWPMGCQYANTFCKSVAEIFNCDTNIQIGNCSQKFIAHFTVKKQPKRTMPKNKTVHI